MGSLQKKMRKNIMRKRTDRVRDAEEKVFQFFEERWSHLLGGNPIPRKHKGIMRQDPAFRGMVAKVLQGEDLGAVDLDVAAEEYRLADGTPKSRFIDEMGGADPRAYFCRTCEDEPVDEPRAQCQDCEQLYPEE